MGGAPGRGDGDSRKNERGKEGNPRKSAFIIESNTTMGKWDVEYALEFHFVGPEMGHLLTDFTSYWES